MNKIISTILVLAFSLSAFSQEVSGIDQIGRNNLNTITTATVTLQLER